jgi:hypothetical protein
MYVPIYSARFCMLKDIQLKPRHTTSVNTYEGTSEHPEIRQRERRRRNITPVDIRPRTEGHRRRAYHGNSNRPTGGGTVFSQEPVRPTVEQLTADRSCLVSGVLTLVFVRTGHSQNTF